MVKVERSSTVPASLKREYRKINGSYSQQDVVEQLKKELMEETNALYNTLEKIRKNPGSKVTERKLRALLRRESAFAAFKRCYAREYGFAEYM